MGQPIQSMEALTGTVISPTDHAILGGQLGAAGFSDAEISNLMGVIERKSIEVATKGAREVALSTITILVDMLVKTHRAAGMEIYRQLCNQTGGMGGTTLHRKCANIALTVANGSPRHAPVAAAPIIGSVR